MQNIVEFFERLGAKIGPAPLGLIVGSVGVITATYALMRIKGINGGPFDGIKIGAGCGFCRPFWLGVGLGIIGTIMITYTVIRK